MKKCFLNEILCRLRFAAQAVCVSIDQINMVSIQPIKSVRLLHGWALGRRFREQGRAWLARSLGSWLRPVKQTWQDAKQVRQQEGTAR